ncbi:MAG: ABC transporter substrate-binding protein [Myxococcota bacterium]|nr:ABC transporter substrate-binding protein [Myxococcota bacterium]
MSSLLLWASLALAGTVTDAKGREVTVDDNARILCLGGSITETVAALGMESQLVGVDASSLYPESVTALPQVGYYRAVSAEGVLSLQPTVILALEGSGPPPVMAQLEATGLPIVYLEEADSVPEARARIETVATALDAEAAPLLSRFDEEVEAGRSAALSGAPRVLFIYARAGGVMNVAGEGTSADAMIRLAGGVNAAAGFSGYKPLTPEAAVAAAPDVVLFTTRGLEASGGKQAALQNPALALTPAGQKGAVAAVDDLLLLGFGPRTGKAITALAQALRDALA